MSVKFFNLFRLAFCLVAVFVALQQTANAQEVTIGNGDTEWLRAYVSSQAAAKGLPAIPASGAIFRSYNSSGGHNSWYDTGVQTIPTLTKVCNILGFESYVRSTCQDNERSHRYRAGKCNYHSPENNNLWAWNGTAWQYYPAAPKYGNTFLATITCGGKEVKKGIKLTRSGPSPVKPGSIVSYDLTITNTGAAALTDALVSDFSINNAGNVIPQQLEYLSATGGTCGFLTGTLSNVIQCAPTNSTIEPGGSRTVTLTYKVPHNAVCNSVIMRQSDALAKYGAQTYQDWTKQMITVHCPPPPTPTPTPSPTPTISTSPILPYVDCVYNLGSGKYRAYFGYDNTGATEQLIPAGVNNSEMVNAFSPSPAERGQVSVFAVGKKTAAFSVDFEGSAIEWQVKPKGGSLNKVSASASSPLCKPIKPIAECVDKATSGNAKANFGYQNDNSFEIKFPVGVYNKFSPDPQDRGQPTAFFPGRVSSAFDVDFTGNIDWTIVSEKATTNDSALPPCTTENQCSSTDITDKLFALDNNALLQRNLIIRYAKYLTQMTAATDKINNFAEDAKSQAQQLYVAAWSNVWSIPKVINNCTNTTICTESDNGVFINSFNVNSAALGDLASQIAREIKRISTGEDKKKDTTMSNRLTQRSNDLQQQNAEVSATIPRFNSVCQ